MVRLLPMTEGEFEAYLARDLGLAILRLHVFTHNAVARTLYEKLGYEVSSLNIAKVLQ